MQDAIEVIRVEQETKRSLAGRVQELEAQLAVDPSDREAQLTSTLEQVGIGDGHSRLLHCSCVCRSLRFQQAD